MKSLADYNPITVMVYFLSVTLVAMFCMNPVITALSLIGSVSLFVVLKKGEGVKSHLYIFLLFLLMAIINPLFYHNGVTVLFVLNDNPVTLEAVLYGIAASAMVVSVLYWFRSFSFIMTGDKLLYLFGSVSPKFALLLSMTLRYIPLFGSQAKKVNKAQKALGLYKEDNAIDNIKGGTRVFSVMVTWALENGIVTADSMAARGYGIGKRTFFSLYRFRKSDAVLLSLTIALLALTVFGISSGAINFAYYPAITTQPVSPLAVITFVSYGILALIPIFIETEESIKWKYLQSKI